SSRAADAEALLVAKSTQFPKDLDVRLQLAQHYYAAKRTAEFGGVIAGIENPRGQWPNTRLRLGVFYEDLGNAKDAFRQYQACAAEEPANRPACRRRQAALLLAAGDRPQAEAVLDGALREDSKDYELRLARAILRLDAPDPAAVDTAVTDLKALAAERPAEARAPFHLGR
ncbi:MAG TPA: hypothetical protein DEH78_04465, partial [Solibacterales bacterium]|nr:hypothetical protein [Bryobacterales bacterium]